MPTKTVQLDPADLNIGQYVRTNRQWFKVRGHVGQGTNALGDLTRVPVTDPKGNETYVSVYGETVEVAVPHTIPGPFTPANIRRAAHRAFEKAEFFRKQAERQYKLELIQLAESRRNVEVLKEDV